MQIEIPAQLAVIQNLLEAIERCLWIGKGKSKSSASIEHTRQATVVTPKLCEMESLVAKPTVLLSTSFIAFLLWEPERAEGWTLPTSVQSYNDQGH